jgi:hypothetical protein
MLRDILIFPTVSLSTVLLMSFLRFPMFAEQPMEQPLNLNENGTRLYSDSEVELLIDEISVAALEAIERASGDAAKAAVLSVLEREAAALHEAQRWHLQADINALGIVQAKKIGIKNAVFAGVVCFVVGMVAGVTVTVGVRN